MIFGDTLNLQVSLRAIAKLSSGGKLNNLRPELRLKTQFTDAYFDTPRCSFFKTGTTLRIRIEGPASRQIICQVQPDATTRTWTTRLERHSRQIELNERLSAELGIGTRKGAPTRHVFSANLSTSCYEIGDKRFAVLLAATTGDIRSAGPVFKYVSEQVVDVELSLRKGSGRAFFDMALALAEKHEARLQPETIAARGFALSSPSLQKGHTKAQKVKLSSTMSVGRGLGCHYTKHDRPFDE